MSEKPGKKYDQNKAPVVRGFMHYFPRAIKAVADVSKYGLEKYKLKYEEKNFLNVEDAFGRYLDANGRHLLDMAIDGTHDLESQRLHLAHQAWNAMSALEVFLIEQDRIPEQPKDYAPTLDDPFGQFAKDVDDDLNGC